MLNKSQVMGMIKGALGGTGAGGASNLTWDDLGMGEVATVEFDKTVKFRERGTSGVYIPDETLEIVSLKVGEKYRITFDGVEYEDTGHAYYGGVQLGDLNVNDKSYLGEYTYPFLCIFTSRETTVITRVPGDHTVKVEHISEDIIPIPEEYLPQGAGGGNVTLQDVLRTDVVILDNQTLAFEDNEGQIAAAFPCDVYPREGDVLSVVWDGTSYECAVSLLYGAVAVVGNGELLGATGLGNGEPFLVAFPDGGICFTNTAGAHTVAISGKLINPIPSEYLDLPEPDTEVAQFYFAYDESTGSVTTLYENVYEQIREAFMAKKVVIAHLSQHVGENGANGSSATLIGQEAYGGVAMFAGTVYNSAGLSGNLTLYVAQNGAMSLGHGDLYLKSSQSTKVFKIAVDDTGTLSASEVSF